MSKNDTVSQAEMLFRFKKLAGVYTDKQAYKQGWDACKKEILKILKQDWTGADLSVNSCDQHYIDKIEEL